MYIKKNMLENILLTFLIVLLYTPNLRYKKKLIHVN